jgi:gamma-tubulin complex component 2
MLVFVQQLLYFCTAEVIEPNWQALMGRLNAEDCKDSTASVVRTVDELMHDHVNFLDTCLKECMLTNSRLLRIHSKLMQTCTMFATYTGWLSRELEKRDPDLAGTEKPQSMSKQQWKRYQAERSQRHRDSASPNTAASATFDEAQFEKMHETVHKYEYNFSRHLQILLDALNHYAATETVVLLGLCARLSTANQGTQYSGLRTDEDGGA